MSGITTHLQTKARGVTALVAGFPTLPYTTEQPIRLLPIQRLRQSARRRSYGNGARR